MKPVLIIPALDPPDTFPEYIDELLDAGFPEIIVVDDGSSDKSVFEKFADKVTLLTHEVNKGKGAALKNAFSTYLDKYDTDTYPGVITLDSDGQHLTKDVKAVYEALLNNPDKLIIGSRDFDSPNVPPKSKFGNTLTRRIFNYLLRIKIRDTQTGLRGIPAKLVEKIVDIPGDRFEYETSMLIALGKKPGIIEVGIDTVYLEENKSTHFNPVKDSIKIYGVIFGTFIKYVLSSLSSFLIDLGLFTLFSKLLFLDIPERILVSTICARIISAVYNYIINRNVVFKSKENVITAAIKYAVLCVLIMLASGYGVTFFSGLLPVEEVLIKIIVDTLLFFVSFFVQKILIFKR